MVTFVPENIKIWMDCEEHGIGLVLYVQTIANDNDLWCIANKESGQIRHYTSNQIRLCANYTDGINLPEKKEEEPNLDLIISELKKRNTL